VFLLIWLKQRMEILLVCDSQKVGIILEHSMTVTISFAVLCKVRVHTPLSMP
jgi:hypothetical protein